MARYDASDLAHRLGRQAEAVCRHYLSNGRREGRYWLVGDVHNTPGRSLFVRLKGGESGKGAAGKWTDYVARGIMLRPRAGRPFFQGSASSPQHNLRPSGRVA
jgi:hypothetical protein